MQKKAISRKRKGKGQLEKKGSLHYHSVSNATVKKPAATSAVKHFFSSEQNSSQRTPNDCYIKFERNNFADTQIHRVFSATSCPYLGTRKGRPIFWQYEMTTYSVILLRKALTVLAEKACVTTMTRAHETIVETNTRSVRTADVGWKCNIAVSNLDNTMIKS